MNGEFRNNMIVEQFKQDYYEHKYTEPYVNTELEWHAKALCYCRHKILHGDQEAVAKKEPVMMGVMVDHYVKDLYGKPMPGHEKVGKYTVFGRPDILNNERLPDELRNKIIEVKYAMFKKKEPNAHDLLQVKVYKWLFNHKYPGYVMYLSPQGYNVFEVESELDNDSILGLIENPRYPFWTKFECKPGFCEIRDECPYRNRR